MTHPLDRLDATPRAPLHPARVENAPKQMAARVTHAGPSLGTGGQERRERIGDDIGGLDRADEHGGIADEIT